MLKLDQLPRKDGFRFIAVLKDGTDEWAEVMPGLHGSLYIAALDGTPIFCQMVGWKHAATSKYQSYEQLR
jgi:hypothetical protein